MSTAKITACPRNNPNRLPQVADSVSAVPKVGAVQCLINRIAEFNLNAVIFFGETGLSVIYVDTFDLKRLPVRSDDVYEIPIS